MNEKEVLVVTPECNIDNGGLSKSCTRFLEMITSIGYKPIVVFSTNDRNNNSLRTIKNIKIITNRFNIVRGGYKPNLYNHLYFGALVKQLKYELKHLSLSAIIAFGGGLNALLASQLKNIFNTTLIIMPRGSEFNLSISDGELFNVNYRSLKEADVIVSLSKELLSSVKSIYYNPSTKYITIPNIVPEPKFNLKETSSKKEVKLGIGAKNINEKKGVSNFINALFYLNNINKKIIFKLDIIGDIDTDLKNNYLKLIKQLDLEKYITFTDSLKHNEFIKIIREWDIVVQSSFFEGFSNTIIEAIYSGIPFVTTNTGYIAETLSPEVPELILYDFYPKEMANKIYNTCLSINFNEWQIKARNILISKSNIEVVKKQWGKLLSNDKIKNNKKIININQHVLSIILHDISTENYSNIDIPIKDFTRLCELVYLKGYKLVSAKQYFESDKKDNLIICTFDDSYLGVFRYAFPVMNKFDFTGTIFVCSEYIDINNSWNKKDKFNRYHLNIEQLKILEQNNWEIGSHGTNHFSMLRLSEKEVINTLEKSKKYLEKFFNNVVSFAYPYGDYNYLISKYAIKVYKNIFAVENGGTHYVLDRHQIKRYSANDIQKILNFN